MPPGVVDLLARPMYGFSQVDSLLAIRPGTARRWIDGYNRAGKTYPPVIREEATGQEVVTWGEFVETRLLAEYRDSGVPLIRMRPAIEKLREEFNARYPLASARLWLDVEGRELVRRVQLEVGLEQRLALVVVRTGQVLWTSEADAFRRSLSWSDPTDAAGAVVASLRPVDDIQEVVIDPLRGFGEPVVRSVRTEVIAELFRAGESRAAIAETYELPEPFVDAAVRYELTRAA